MNLSSPHRHILDGTVRVFLAEALILPTGLLTVIFLTRKLGPECYGLFTISAAVAIWIEVFISAIFSRATVKFISEATDWRPVGSVVLRLHVTAGLLAALLLFCLASPLATLFKEPVLATYFRLFALDIPLFSLAMAHRNILTGIGDFRQRALISVGRWTTRLLLIVLLVELGFSVPGAILGSIGASLIELIIGRFYVRPSLFYAEPFPARQLFGYALPLSLFALSMHLFSKLDLFMLKIMGGTIDQAGIYSAAQNLSIVPGIFAFSFSPLLLSTLGRLLGGGEDRSAKELARDALRAVFWLLPLAGMTAGASREIVGLVFGPQYIEAAALLALLIFAAIASLMISVATAILTAAGKPGWTFALAGPLVPLAIAGHLCLIPRFGAVGASLTSTFFACLAALAAVVAVHKIWRILPPAATMARSAFICAAAFALAAFWSTPGFLLLLKVGLVGLLITLAFLLTGELSAREVAFLRSILPFQTATE